MKLVFYSLVLNHHQAYIADEFYRLLGDGYAFVETAECHDSKGAVDDYSKRPYLLRAWKSVEAYGKAMEFAMTAEVCVFGGYEALPFEKARMRKSLLSFDMGERMLKRGWLNLASPRILQMVLAYHLGRWSKKPIYKLCMSAFAAKDQYKLMSFKNRCYKWGYFTSVDEDFGVEASLDVSTKDTCYTLMWCSRYLSLKHPEMPIELAAKLKSKGYKFYINMYGDEGNAAKHDSVYPRCQLETLICRLGVNDCVSLKGNCPNNEILGAMRASDIFLFTSDRMEGWGAVANESLANGCVLVASDAIGSSPYLVKDGENGFMFRSEDAYSLTEKVEWLLEHPVEMRRMQHAACERMKHLWSPKKGAEARMRLIEDLKHGHDTSISEGPCSKA